MERARGRGQAQRQVHLAADENRPDCLDVVAAVVGDVDRQRVSPGRQVDVAAVNAQGSGARFAQNSLRTGAVTPIDGGSEVVDRRVEVGIVEGGDRVAEGRAHVRREVAAGGVAERRIADGHGSGRGGGAGAHVLDRHAQGKAALIAVGMVAADAVGARGRVAEDDSLGPGAVAPVDGRAEVADRPIEVGIGEGGDRGAEARPLDRGGVGTDDVAEGCVGDGEDAVRVRLEAGVVDRHHGAVAAFFGEGVAPVDEELAGRAGRSDGARRAAAVAPVDAGDEVGHCGSRVGIGEGCD